MNRLFIAMGVAAACSAPLWGQTPAPRAAFDVTSVQPSAQPRPGMRGGQLRGNRYEIRNATMVDLIRTAYNVQPERIRVVTCENVSLQQFGQLLPQIASDYTRAAAVDKTGLPGGYDFILNFSPIQQVQGPRPEAGAVGTGASLDPTGALSLQDAVRRQLGIKLEDTKLPVPVLVIDSIRATPLDN